MHRVHDLTKKCLDHVFLLFQPQAIVDVPRFHRSAADCVEAIEPRARKAGFSAEQARQIKYAMVAFLDEVAQARPGPVADYWEQHLLQRDYFNEVRAGENFFVQIERLLEARRDDVGSLDVLQVYATCMFLGFRGKFVARADAKGYDALLRRVEDRLKERLTGDEGLPPAKPADWRFPRPANRIMLWCAGLAFLFAVVMLFNYRGELLADGERLARLLGGAGQ